MKSYWWWRLNGCRWRGAMSPAAVDEEEAVNCWWWERKEIVAGVPLLMKIEEEAVSCWWWEKKEIVAGVPLLMKIEEEARSRELLRRSSPLLMKRNPRPWALMTGLWSEYWSEEREGVKTGTWPWPWSSPLLWLPVPGWLIREGD